MNARGLIERLQLQPHPEGGWFREIHRATQTVTTNRGTRSALTTIYYLLERHQLSRWHVVQSDEIWHFYAGAPLELIVYDPATRACNPTVIDVPTTEREPVGIVRAGEWQAARSLGDYSLVGCNVGPGFDFADFQFVSALDGYADHFTGQLTQYRDLL
jgi:predicted cupin superfamily sugar epimerase